MRKRRTPREWRKQKGEIGRQYARLRRSRSASEKSARNEAGTRWLSSLLHEPEPRIALGSLGIGASSAPSKAIYVTACMRRLRSRLFSLIKTETALFIVTGERGVGKTWFASWLARELRDAGHVAMVLDQPVAALRPVLEELSRELGAATRLDRVNEWMRHISDALTARCAGGSAVLLIDDAELASDTVFSELPSLVLHNGDRPVLRIVLLGQPSLLDRINIPAFAKVKKQIGLLGSLAPLNQREIASFLQHREPLRTPTTLCPDAMRTLLRHTAGEPSTTGFVWSQAISLASDNQCESPLAEHVEAAAALLRPNLRARNQAAAISRAHASGGIAGSQVVSKVARRRIPRVPVEALRTYAGAQKLGWHLSGMAAAAALAFILASGVVNWPAENAAGPLDTASVPVQPELHPKELAADAHPSTSTLPDEAPPVPPESRPDEHQVVALAPMTTSSVPSEPKPSVAPEPVPPEPSPAVEADRKDVQIAALPPVTSAPDAVSGSADTSAAEEKAPPSGPVKNGIATEEQPATEPPAAVAENTSRNLLASIPPATPNMAPKMKPAQRSSEAEMAGRHHDKPHRDAHGKKEAPPALVASLQGRTRSTAPSVVANGESHTETAAPAPSSPAPAAPQQAAEVASSSSTTQCVNYRSNVNFALSATPVHGLVCRAANGQWWLVNQQSG